MTPERRRTRTVHVGGVAVGGGGRVSVQTMTKTDTRDVGATVAQIREVAALGCDIIRVAVPDEAAARAIKAIRAGISIPLVADIHFNHRLAILAVESGADALRINPGNIGAAAHVREVVKVAGERGVPIRIGVNSGSVEADLLAVHGGPTPAALVDSALRHVRILDDAGFTAIKISVKASDALRTIEAYRLLSRATDHPLHLGVTEAGTFLPGTVRSSVAMGILLAEGVGDTIRVSLTDSPIQEVRVGLEILRALGLRAPGPGVVSCPTCGRIEVDVISAAARIEAELEKYQLENPAVSLPQVAVMGCMVNGPGEARHADIAVAGGKGKFALYVKGAHVETVSEERVVGAVLARVREWKNA